MMLTTRPDGIVWLIRGHVGSLGLRGNGYQKVKSGEEGVEIPEGFAHMLPATVAFVDSTLNTLS